MEIQPFLNLRKTFNPSTTNKFISDDFMCMILIAESEEKAKKNH